MVSFSDTGSNPGTVMVEPLDASITVIAVRCSRRPIDEATVTELKSQIMCLVGGYVYPSYVSHQAGLVSGV